MGTAGLVDFELLEKKINQAAEYIEQLKKETGARTLTEGQPVFEPAPAAATS